MMIWINCDKFNSCEPGLAQITDLGSLPGIPIPPPGGIPPLGNLPLIGSINIPGPPPLNGSRSPSPMANGADGSPLQDKQERNKNKKNKIENALSKTF